MKGIHKKLFAAAALTGVMFAGTFAVHAAPVNAVNGYTSVHDNIMVNGANFGRCNALGVLAAAVCNLNGTLVPAIGLVVDACKTVGVDLAVDPAVANCTEVSCEVLGTC
jgi:hypothetical protein